MIFNIVPNKSVGEIDFGMERVEIRGVLKGFREEFKKSALSKNTTDDFGYCHVFYDISNKCNAIEFFDDVKLIYDSKNIFELTVNELKEIFPDMIEEYGSYISKKYSIGIYVEENKIESVLIGCEGYYC